VTKGKGVGRVGVITKIEKHPGAFDIIHLRDSKDHTFATRKDNVFTIGIGKKPMIALPKTQGIKLTIMEERDIRLAKQQRTVHNQNKRKEMTGGTIKTDAIIELRKHE